jgi:hypothetical protein
MFSITKKIGNRMVALDLHAVPVRLADGSEARAEKLTRDQLFEAVKALGLDVTPALGWQDLATELAISIFQHGKASAA